MGDRTAQWTIAVDIIQFQGGTFVAAQDIFDCLSEVMDPKLKRIAKTGERDQIATSLTPFWAGRSILQNKPGRVLSMMLPQRPVLHVFGLLRGKGAWWQDIGSTANVTGNKSLGL